MHLVSRDPAHISQPVIPQRVPGRRVLITVASSEGGFSCRYVGGAPGKIDLYVGKEVIRRAIPMDDATNQLIELIKEHDR